MSIEIFPLDKVVFDGVPVCLGMERTRWKMQSGQDS